MSNAIENRDNVTQIKLARLERLCSGFPVLSSEKRQDYEELLICLLHAYRPRCFPAERLIKYLTDEEWEIGRYKRHKILLIERRLHARLAYQAYREKAAPENKAMLARTLLDQQAVPFTLPEEALDGLIAKIDAMLLRPAQEIDHARALEVCIVYFQHLDRLLNAAIARRNAILADIERYDHWFDPALELAPGLEPDHASSALDAVTVHAAGDGRGSEEQASNGEVLDIAPALAPPQDARS